MESVIVDYMLKSNDKRIIINYFIQGNPLSIVIEGGLI